MSQENVEIVRRGLEYFLRTDEHLWETIDAEVEIHDHDLSDADVYRGHAGWLKWEDHFDSMWEDGGGLEPEEYIDAGDDKVVTVLRLWAQGRGGIKLEWQDGAVFTLWEGQDCPTGLLRKPGRGPRSRGLRE